MLPLRISNATRVLAEDQPEYTPLAILDEVVDGVPYMSSVWEPTPAERQMLIDGGAIVLRIVGVQHPPVRLETQPAPGVTE